MTKTKIFVLLSAALLVALSGCGLSSEPEIAQEIDLPTPVPVVDAPASVPDLTRGAAFYADHCVMCHGDIGRGDGEMVLDGRLQNQPPDLGVAEARAEQSPLDYLQAITEGNMMVGMPPFSSYTVEERWDVAAYVYLGGISAESYQLGAQLYAADCAVCHGSTGQGDGPEAPEIMPDLADRTYWAEQTDGSVYTAIGQGYPPAMPAFAEQYSEDQLQAVTSYVRGLAVVGEPGFPGLADDGTTLADVPEPVATEEVTAVAEADAEEAANTADEPEAVAEPESITVTGQVTNGTTAGEIPAGAVITLHMFDPPEFTESTLETTLDETGNYTFADVAHVAGRAYLLSLQQDGVFFSSTVYSWEDSAAPVLETAVEIFDTTDDPAVVQVTAGVMRITFTDFGMEVAEVLNIENSSDRLFLTGETFTENQQVALRIPLPPGAGGVGFEPGMQNTRFFVSEDGTEVIDTQPLRPGVEQIFFSYFIAYEDGAIIEQVIPYAVNGPFHLLIEAEQVAVESGMFSGAGERVDMGGQLFDAYVAELALPAGEVISYTVTGVPDAVAANANAAAGDSGGLSPVVLVLIVVGLVFIGAGGFLFLLRQGGSDPNQAAIDDLLDQIAELDDQHDQGMLNHDYYQQTRAEFKAQLAELMQGQSGGENGDDS